MERTSRTESLISPVNAPPSAPTPAPAPSPSKHARLVSLDIVRGFTIALMIFVDEVGDVYATLNHSPWNNTTLADYVMPWFLFMVGASLSMSLKKFKGTREARLRGTRFVTERALKLFFLGVLLQGGGWIMNGYNLATMRWCGILNRIGFAYFFAGCIELWVPERNRERVPEYTPAAAHVAVFSDQAYKWAAASLFVVLHLALTFGVFVPSWEARYGYAPSLSNTTSSAPSKYLAVSERYTIACDVRGAVATPECSASSYFDRLLLGQEHLGVWMSKRLPECSTCSPQQPGHWAPKGCEWNPQAPPWCFTHMYDPEGVLSTIPSVMSVWVGAHFGRLVAAEGISRPRGVLTHWCALAAALSALGWLVHFTAWPMNKQLWSTSYLLWMAGSCGAALALVYALVDTASPKAPPPLRTRAARLLLAPLQFMGMNAILLFFWNCSVHRVIDQLYIATPKPGGGTLHVCKMNGLTETPCTLTWWVHEELLAFVTDDATRHLVYVLIKIGCFMVAAWACYRRGYFWKI